MIPAFKLLCLINTNDKKYLYGRLSFINYLLTKVPAHRLRVDAQVMTKFIWEKIFVIVLYWNSKSGINRKYYYFYDAVIFRKQKKTNILGDFYKFKKDAKSLFHNMGLELHVLENTRIVN